jgi:hypothetical protein
MGAHINKTGQFQSDKYPDCPPDKVLLSLHDAKAQPLLWEYENDDKEFGEDIKARLDMIGYKHTATCRIELEDLAWLLHTLSNANSIIEGEGLDDDEEAEDIKDRLHEIATKHSIELNTSEPE